MFKNVKNGALIPDISSTKLKELKGTSKIRCTAACKQYGDTCQAATYHSLTRHCQLYKNYDKLMKTDDLDLNMYISGKAKTTLVAI